MGPQDGRPGRAGGCGRRVPRTRGRSRRGRRARCGPGPPERRRPAPAPPARPRRAGSGSRGPGRPARSPFVPRRVAIPPLSCSDGTSLSCRAIDPGSPGRAHSGPERTVSVGAGTMPGRQPWRPADSVPDGDRGGPSARVVRSCGYNPHVQFLFVCTANICRSPMAAALFAAQTPGPHRLGGGLLGRSPLRSPGGAGQGARRGARGDGPLRDRPPGPSQPAADRGHGHRGRTWSSAWAGATSRRRSSSTRRAGRGRSC